MTSPLRTGPLHARHTERGATWAERESMRVASAFDAGDAARREVAGIADLSHLRRIGFKGPQSVAWLEAQGIAVPPLPNAWTQLADGARLLRLGRSEFLVEEPASAARIAALGDALAGAGGVYPVPRFDAALLLVGARIGEVLLQTCAFDFASIATGTPAVVMTSMVGVGVAVMVCDDPARPAPRHYRLWCDGSYGDYLWTTLVGIAGELGGGAVGLAALDASLL